MGKHIHSKDPKKALITQALRNKFGEPRAKITLVSEINPGVYQGRVLVWNLGKQTFTVLATGQVTDADLARVAAE